MCYLSHHGLLTLVLDRKDENGKMMFSSKSSNSPCFAAIFDGTKDLRQRGHVACRYANHRSKQALWKRCSHLSSLTSSPSSIMQRQTTQFTCSQDPGARLYLSTLNSWMIPNMKWSRDSRFGRRKGESVGQAKWVRARMRKCTATDRAMNLEKRIRMERETRKKGKRGRETESVRVHISVEIKGREVVKYDIIEQECFDRWRRPSLHSVGGVHGIQDWVSWMEDKGWMLDLKQGIRGNGFVDPVGVWHWMWNYRPYHQM